MKYLIYADGACHGNGKSYARISGSFAVWKTPEMMMKNRVLAESSPIFHANRIDLVIPEGARATNNIAEALTLNAAVIWACDNNLFRKGNHVTICMDSELILSQITGLYNTDDASLREIHTRTHALLTEAEKTAGRKMKDMLSFDWISGETMKASVIGH